MKNLLQDTGLLLDEIKSSGKSVIIFDVFDTIIHRKSHPEDLKKIFASRLISYLGIEGYTSEEMYNLRAQGERELCLESNNKGYDLEFKFNDLCHWLYESLRACIGNRLSSSEFVRIAREIEYTVEITNQYVDENVIATIKQLKADEYTIICCSDFYLECSLIRRLLKEYGIDDLFTKVYVSSEYLLTKRSGRLYYQILEEYSADLCLMIGDNEESDSRQAEAVGIASILLDRSWAQTLHSKFRENFEISYFKKKINSLISTNEDTLFGEFALTSFYFIHNLYLQLHSKGYKDVFFLAREGQVLKQMFDVYQETCVKNPELKINSHYLMASRRSTFMPSLNKLEHEDFFNLFRQYVNISFAEFMYSLGFSDSDIDPLANQLGIDKNKRERNFPKSEAWIKTLISDGFYQLYESRRTSQKASFIKYLTQFNRHDPGRLALVDVGWKGTIQDNIYKTLDESVTIEGFYIGLVVPVNNFDSKNTKHGLLFSKDTINKLQSIFDENRSLYEVLFAANHGSVISFNENAKGEIHVDQEDFEDEVQFYKNSILPLIERIKMIYKNICLQYAKTSIDEDALTEIVARHHSRMVLFPNKKELAWHLNLYHVENFGVFERNVFNQENTSVSLLRRFENYFDYKYHPNKYTVDSIWPAAEFTKGGLHKSLSKYSSNKFNSIFNK